MNRQEAINIVKKNWPDSSFTSLREALEFLIPELMNTDDKKIKEAIIKGIIHAAEEGCFCADNYSVKECVDWIEKHVEQKPAVDTKVIIPKFRVGDIIQHIPLEKWDKTKKITHIDETGYYFDHSHQGDTVSGGFIGFSFENEYELVEQKPAWSEEDKNMLQSILDEYKSMPIEKRNWLKSLEERVQLQNK